MRSVYRVPATGSWYRSHSLLFLKRNKKHLTFQSPWNILIAEEENPRGPSSAMAQEPLILGWASSFFTHLRGKAEAFSSCLVQHTAFIMLGRQPLAVKNRKRTPHVSVPGFAYPNYVGFALIASARRPDRYRPSGLPAAGSP